VRCDSGERMKVACAIIGSGNIGTDLFYKLSRSDRLEPVWMVGIEPASAGLARAAALGSKTTHGGLVSAIDEIAADGVKIAFDATSASEHAKHAALLERAGILSIDLTPAAIGPYCVPSVNLASYVGNGVPDVNLVSCGGQATIPMVAAVTRVQAVAYAEIVATVASKSAGPGTRKNIDEFTRTTARGLERVGGATRGKAIIILNPAEPPLLMRNTVHCLTESDPERPAILDSIAEMAEDVQRYVPGYRLKNEVVFDGRRISVYLEIEGRGDFLPTYAGNLDIMTAAATRAGELFAAAIGGPVREAAS
jgi:acetaldehyde/propanal dehydrogenase